MHGDEGDDPSDYDAWDDIDDDDEDPETGDIHDEEGVAAAAAAGHVHDPSHPPLDGEEDDGDDPEDDMDVDDDEDEDDDEDTEGSEGDDDEEQAEDNAMFGDFFENIDFDVEADGFMMPGGAMAGRNGGRRNRRFGNRGDFGIAGFPEHLEIHVSDGMSPPVLLNDLIGVPGSLSMARGAFGDQPTLNDGILPHPMLNRQAMTSQQQRRPSNLGSQDSVSGARNPIQLPDPTGREFTPSHALQLLEQVLNNAAGRTGGTYRIQFPGFDDPAANRFMGGAMHGILDTTRDALADSTDFRPIKTSDRWTQEACLIFGPQFDQKITGIQEKLIAALLPIAQEIEKKKKAKEEKEKEEKRKKAEEEAKAKLKALAEKAEEEAARKAAESSEATAPATTTMEVEGTPVPPASTGTAAATSSSSTITFHGTTIDLANSGIDPTFLEALPEDLRAEVLAQHFRDQIRTGGNLPTEISEEFLEALPDDIRDEVLQQEQAERDARERPRTNAIPIGGMRPGLQDMAFPDLMDSPFAQLFGAVGQVPPTIGASSAAAKKTTAGEAAKKLPQKEPAQLMDRGSITTLVKMLFIPQALSRSYLHPLMVNVCENSKSRSELLSFLISIIQDCIATDLSKFTSKSKARPSLSRKSSSFQNIVAALVATSGMENFSTVAIQRCLDLFMELVSKNESVTGFFLTESDLILATGKTPKKRSSKVHVRYPLMALLAFIEKPIFLKNSALMDNLTQLIAAIVQPLSKVSPPAASTAATDRTSPVAITPPTNSSSENAIAAV